MEVYIDDMLVKSLKLEDHIPQLKECFETLNKYGMKLNPAKCSFGVASGEFWATRSTDKCLPFLWDDSCEEAFKQLKSYLSEPPILSKPVVGETLYLYVSVSTDCNKRCLG
ncbi:hypothetical protein V5N11_030325 [Cardamine amara subsp. amara]|uniref:Reverse transcriptase domain-containing protein n=1 Tax=Cardamine amara subsp. amara TaxID=228776 RepID=A0ABD1AVB2_CARAN